MDLFGLAFCGAFMVWMFVVAGSMWGEGKTVMGRIAFGLGLIGVYGFFHFSK